MSDPTAHCDFCGLPLPRAWWSRSAPSASADGPQYCCFGCHFAAGVTRERGETGAIRWTMTRLGFSIFLSMNVMAFTMALWSGDVYGSSAGALAETLNGLFRYLCLLFSLPVLLMLGGPLCDNAWKSLRRGQFSTDLLLLSGIVASFAYSAVSVIRDAGPIYFEVGCVILVMVTLGRWLEATGRQRAGAALDELEKLLPETVRVLCNGVTTSVATSSVKIGDRLRVLPGERFPVDGRLVHNSAEVDEQVLSGESRPVTRHPGDLIHAGTLNLDGDVVVETTVLPGADSLHRLIELVKRARETKGPHQQQADRLSEFVFPLVSGIALFTFAWHWSAAGLEAGLMAGLSVVLVACPCALGLAAPLTIWSALGLAARKQVLFRNGEALERLADIRAVRFDKTGTLTSGTMRVMEIVDDGETPHTTILQLATTLAGSSLHPCSRAICALGNVATGASAAASGIRLVAGRGLLGQIDVLRQTACLGSAAFMVESGLIANPVMRAAIERNRQNGRSISCIGWNGRVRGLFVFDEDLRPEAAPALGWLKCHHFDVAVLTGDHAGRAARLAEKLQVPVAAELLPDQKLAAIRATRAEIGPVAMVGDGINDAPALAAADVGIALGCGTDVSRDAAAVCLLGNDLERLCWALEFSQNTARILRRNLYWAFGYNTVGVALAALGWLNPAAAALLMVVSSALVVRNALSARVDTPSSSPAEHVPVIQRSESDRANDLPLVQHPISQPLQSAEAMEQPDSVVELAG